MPAAAPSASTSGRSCTARATRRSPRMRRATAARSAASAFTRPPPARRRACPRRRREHPPRSRTRPRRRRARPRRRPPARLRRRPPRLRPARLRQRARPLPPARPRRLRGGAGVVLSLGLPRRAAARLELGRLPADQALDALGVDRRRVVDELDLRGALEAQARRDGGLQHAARLPQHLEGRFALPGRAEDADEHLGVPEVGRGLDPGDGDEPHARVLEALDDGRRDRLLDALVDPQEAMSHRLSTPSTVRSTTRTSPSRPCR